MATQTGMSTKHLEMHQYGSFGGGGLLLSFFEDWSMALKSPIHIQGSSTKDLRCPSSSQDLYL